VRVVLVPELRAWLAWRRERAERGWWGEALRKPPFLEREFH